MTKIELKGDLSISNAEELQKVFISVSEKKVDIELDVSQLDDVDTSIIQLVYSLYRQLKDRTITITGPISSTVKKRLYICGILSEPDADDESIARTIAEITREAK